VSKSAQFSEKMQNAIEMPKITGYTYPINVFNNENTRAVNKG